MSNPFLALSVGTITPLPASDGLPAAGHHWSQAQIDALIAAHAARRPLLVRGEAGSGKSQMARAAARVLGSALHREVIHARFEALDLLYRFDSVERLAEAQAQQVEHVKDRSRYLRPGKFWQALADCQPQAPHPVLLIDEIDKADADVPNALLDALGNGRFEVEWTDQVVQPGSGEMPLIIITTNEERELPPAFVRRCLVLNLNPPKDETAFVEWLAQRAKAHTTLKIAATVAQAAASKLWADRQAAMELGQQAVGLAEYIDLLQALHELTGCLRGAARARAQQQWMDRLATYFLVKGAGMAQTPAAAPAPAGQAG